MKTDFSLAYLLLTQYGLERLDVLRPRRCMCLKLQPPPSLFQPASAVSLIAPHGLGLQKTNVCKLSGRLPWVWLPYYGIRSPKFLCLPLIFRNSLVGGWILPELGENRSCGNHKRKMPAKNQKSVFCADIWPRICTLSRQQPQFSLPATNFSKAVWLGARLLHFSAAQDLARKTWKFFF